MGLFDKLKDVGSGLFGKPKQPEKKPEENRVYSVLNLHKSQSTGDLIAAHNAVQLYYQRWMSQREYYHDFMHPDSHWTAEEKVVLAKKKKAAIAFSKMISSWRTYIGALIQNKYDIKPAPVEPTDQNLADVYSALYAHTAFTNQVRTRDIDRISESWIGGNSWQESFVEQSPGRAPNVVVRNQNNFAIYPDPNRRDLVTNSDCKFIDRVGWYSMDDLISTYPEMEDEIREGLTAATSISYLADKPYADRQHETLDQKNGRYKVIERFYKVFKRQYYGVDIKGKRTDLGYDLTSDQQGEYKTQNPNGQLFNEPEEFLYLAVCCTSMGKYLHNAPYHIQPKDAVSGKIMFTLYELIDEDIGSVPSGHVEHMIGPNKVIDALVVNQLAQAKNASGQSRIGNPDHFDEAGQIELDKHASDGDRMFWKKKDAPAGNPIELMPMGQLTVDTDKGIQFATENIQDNSSTPPALKGLIESSNTPAALNEQRIQQASVQSEVQVNNYKNFLTQRAKLWMFIWNECFTAEQVIRNLEKKTPQDPDHITINQLVMDDWGQPQRLNHLQEADAYDIVFEDSWQSPSNKAKAIKQITEALGAPGISNDPTLTAIFSQYLFHLYDIPEDIKTKVTGYLDQKVQAAQQPQQPQQEKPKVSLSLKGDLHDPETLAFMEAIGELPPGFAEQQASSPGSQVKQAGDIADVAKKHVDLQAARKDLHGKTLDNHQQLQSIADNEAQATTPAHPAKNTRALQPA